MKKYLLIIGLCGKLLMAVTIDIDGTGIGLAIFGAVKNAVKNSISGDSSTVKSATKDNKMSLGNINVGDLSPRAQRLHGDCTNESSKTSISSCDELSRMFSDGDGVPRDNDAREILKVSAYKISKKNCSNGVVGSCTQIANRFERLYGDDQEELKFEEYSQLMQYCDNSDMKSCYKFIDNFKNFYFYYNSSIHACGREVEDLTCEERLEKMAAEKAIVSCKNGNINSCGMLVDRAEDNIYNCATPFEEKIFAAEKACVGGIAKHCTYIGKHYESENNYKKAIEFYNIGCASKNKESCERLKKLQ